MAKGEKSGGAGSSFDLATTLGLVLGVVFIVLAIIVTFPKGDQKFEVTPGNLENFFDPSSIMIVLGGTVSALLVSYPLSFFGQIPKHIKVAFMPTKFDAKEYIQTIVEIAKPARVDGILSIQDKVDAIPDTFFRNSLHLVIDGIDAEKVKAMMESELDYMDALITTLYGSFLANLIFAPMSNKLKVRHDEEMLCKMIVCEGVQGIQAGDNPRFIEEKLIQMLPAKIAATMGEDGEGGGGKKKGKK